MYKAIFDRQNMFNTMFLHVNLRLIILFYQLCFFVNIDNNDEFVNRSLLLNIEQTELFVNN